MGAPNSLWILAEATAEGLSSVSLEALSAAQKLAGSQAIPITAVLMAGPGDTGALTQPLIQGGAQRVLVIQHDLLATYQVELYTHALAQAIEAQKPSIVLAGATSMGRDVLPRVAAKLKAACLADAVEIGLSAEGALEVTRPVFGESLLAQAVGTPDQLQLATLRVKAFPPAALDASRTGSVETFTPDLNPMMAHTKLLELLKAEAKAGRKLEEADIIVSGGRGLKGPENFHLIEELADALGAAVGASRAVVDAGWRPHSEQVGQTGKTVSPKLYIAVGISGAIQHQVGMSTSQYIVAINKDPDAPIFQLADYGIVGDALEILPVLTHAIREQRLAAV